MRGFALVVALMLSGASFAQDGRYSTTQGGGTVGNSQDSGAGAQNSNANTDTLPRSPFGAGSPPAASGSAAAANTTPQNIDDMFSGTTANNSGTRPATAAPRNLLPLSTGDAQPITGRDSSPPVPAAYTPGATGPSAAQANGLTPSAMMRAMLTSQAGSQLTGQPVSLVEVVAGARTRAEQTQRVEAYWDLCSSVADYYLSLRELDEVRQYVQRGGAGQAFDQVVAEMQVRIGTARRSAVTSQMRLASYMGRSSGFLPLPADTPHCASYNAQFEQIFPRGGPPEARELAALLPARHTELKVAASAVIDAEQFLNSFGSSRSGDIEGYKQALHLLALRRRAFVQIARDYNRRIARYTELASPGQVSPERLTGMLIRSSVSTATKSASPVPQPNRQSRTSPAPPTTFAEGSQAITADTNVGSDNAVQPASSIEPTSARKAGETNEHSVLIRSQ